MSVKPKCQPHDGAIGVKVAPHLALRDQGCLHDIEIMKIIHVAVLVKMVNRPIYIAYQK